MKDNTTDLCSTVEHKDASQKPKCTYTAINTLQKIQLPRNFYCISDISANVERVNLTSIAYIVQMESIDLKAHVQMREGFEIFIEHYNREETPYTIDSSGNYWVWPDVALFIVDHVTPTFQIVSIKRKIITGDALNTPEGCCKSAALLCRYIVTGVSDGNNKEPITGSMIRDSKKMVELVSQLVGVLSRVWNDRRL